MSSPENTTLNCPHCDLESTVETAASVNVTNRPWARDAVLAGQFHRYTCEGCGDSFVVERDFLYVDSNARVFIMVYDASTVGEWQTLEKHTEDTVIEVLQSMNPAAEELVLNYEVRTVFGLQGLADKIRIQDAGLDDAVVELLKMELFLNHPDLQEDGGREIYVSDVALVDDLIELEAVDREGVRPPLHFGANLERYRELEQARPTLVERFPSLFHRTFRAFRRLASETVEQPATTAT